MIVSCDEQDIRSGFQALQADVPTPNLRDDLSHRRVGRCKGMFLWIKMLEDDLSGGKSKRRFGGEGSVVYNTNNMILRNMRGSRYYHNIRLFVSYCYNIRGPYIIFPDDILPI
jgi:hypothetical protein